MKLIAIRPGFYAGDRIRKGVTFEFDSDATVTVKRDGKDVTLPVRTPKWALPAGEAKAVLARDAAKEAASGGDTKPKGAQAAAKSKHLEASGLA